MTSRDKDRPPARRQGAGNQLRSSEPYHGAAIDRTHRLWRRGYPEVSDYDLASAVAAVDRAVKGRGS